ncbi:gluconate 2-dehydrogenase subunit 3 family protein [Runella limosa]|uniref:gluconate 2-dehydrogenase subunit 3 family protein n=1 Tax=Runella limosa TaxID=370978 RepID=UPI00048B3BBC|nr:gluconate 2-dehydrogenase subunit 3 family protein [Runella limosa]
MNRREVIKSVALMFGGTLSAPTLMAMNHWEQNSPIPTTSAAFSLTEQQRKIVAEVAEMIIPRTNTVGAKDVGVPAFIEMMLKDCYLQPDHQRFLEGLTSLEQLKFLELNEGERRGALKMMEQQTKEQMKVPSKTVPFWRLMKELTLLGYFTSEAGIKASFEYVQIPGKLENIKLKPNQKLYAY